MRYKIKTIVNKIFKEPYYKTELHFGYDCVGVELIRCLNEKEILLSEVEELKTQLDTEICWIRISDEGNFILGYDISNMILSEFGNWKNYQERYGLN